MYTAMRMRDEGWPEVGNYLVARQLLNVQRRAVFVMDSAETANGTDDDGDGLIDEGRVLLREGAVTLDTLEDVENLVFAIDRRMLKIRLTVARPAKSGRSMDDFAVA